MIRHLWLATAAAAMLISTQANAGVQDSIFEGSVIPLSQFTNPASMGGFQRLDITADFGPDFDLFRQELDGDEVFGTYEEDDSGFVSSWNVSYLLDGDYEASGTCFFSFIRTYEINEIEGDNDYFGILIRTGPSDLIDVRPPATTTANSPLVRQVKSG